jgi:hypothetical protein
VSSCDPGPDSTEVPADPFGGAVATGPADAGGSAGRLAAELKKPPRPSSALPISLGTIQTLFASPWAICGSICMYW